MRHIKDKLYNYYVCRDERIRYEYERYVIEHMEEHRLFRTRHWKLLFKLNWFYGVRKQSGPYMYLDMDMNRISNSDGCVENDGSSDKNTSLIVKDNNKEKINKKSNQVKSIKPYFYMKSLLSYDVISFDVFDTLLFRPFLNPYDMFIMLENDFKLLNFDKIRRDAAKKATLISECEHGNSEITIFDIYSEIEKKTGIPKEKGISLEFDLEKRMCKSNPYMKQVFSMLKDQGKTIIAVSDMYYPEYMIKELLERNGFNGIDKIFVSCDYHTGKSDRLFEFVRKHFPNKSIIHIGDNKNKDVNMPEKYGIKAILYPNVNENGIAHGKGMAGVIRSAYEGVVNTALLKDMDDVSPQYEYGYKYGGICALGFCQWIYKKAASKAVEKVLFVSRDGYILNKVYHKFFSQNQSIYVYWSRMAGLKIAPEYDKATFIQDTLYRRKNDSNPLTICEWIDMLGYTFLKDELIKYSLRESDLVIENNIHIIEKLINDNWDLIVEWSSNNDYAAREYWKRVIGSSNRVMLVDLGWQGQSMMLLKWLIEKKWEIDCEVSISLFASCSSHDNGNQAFLLNNSLDVYAFSQSFNKDIYDVFRNCHNGRVKSMFELFFQAPHPSFDSYCLSNDNKIEYNFSIPEVENYKYINRIHSGMIDFCERYYSFFSNDLYMLNIEGSDALTPFLKILNNPKYITKTLGDMIFPLDVIFDDYDLKNHKFIDVMRDSWT